MSRAERSRNVPSGVIRDPRPFRAEGKSDPDPGRAVAGQGDALRTAAVDAGPGVGVARQPTQRSDWRDVPLTEAARTAFERQHERRLAFGPIRPDDYVFA